MPATEIGKPVPDQLVVPRGRVLRPDQRVLQKPSLCGPATVSMILGAEGVHVDQERLAQFLGSSVPESALRYLSTPLPTVEDPARAGTSGLGSFAATTTEVFSRIGVPFVVSPYFWDGDMADLRDVIGDGLEYGRVMANHPDSLNNTRGGLGHYTEVAGINGAVTIKDTYPGNNGIYDARIDRLALGLDTVDPMGNRRGLLLFRRIQHQDATQI